MAKSWGMSRTVFSPASARSGPGARPTDLDDDFDGEDEDEDEVAKVGADAPRAAPPPPQEAAQAPVADPRRDLGRRNAQPHFDRRPSVGDERPGHRRAAAAVRAAQRAAGPPGTSAILGLPLVYLAAQMMLGRLPWLPPFIANRSMSREDFAATISRATPIIARAEKLLKPRLSLFVRHRAERVIGALCLILAIVLLLPDPPGHMLPAFAICLLALGVLERDGALGADRRCGGRLQPVPCRRRRLRAVQGGDLSARQRLLIARAQAPVRTKRCNRVAVCCVAPRDGCNAAAFRP